jgi:putative FmdB family regulatory protein
MATYPYECESCETPFEFEMSMKEYEPKGTYPCPNCNSEETIRIFTVPYVNFSGDGWASKNNRIAGQMRDKRKKLSSKEREQKGDGMVPSLAPNVGGERVESWSEASKLAKDKGKDTSGYDSYARKEKAGSA